MSCRPQLGVGWLLAVLAAACTLEGKPLRAGVAKADVTPPAGEHMWGYAERQTKGSPGSILTLDGRSDRNPSGASARRLASRTRLPTSWCKPPTLTPDR